MKAAKKIILVLKTLIFLFIFYVLCLGVAFILKDDTESYARVLMHEFYSQDNIDIMYCGASHVSHGITPVVADKITGKNNFSTGTASQTIEGTYAILQQAVKQFKIEKVFLEMDFAVSAKYAKNNRNGFSADYIVSDYIKDPSIKWNYLFSISSPKYYLNHLLPIGKDKHMTLNPKKVVKKIKSLVTGQYFKYEYVSSDSEYDGKGCVLNTDVIKNGSFSSNTEQGKIKLDNISDEYKNTIDKIITLCKNNNVELIFYSMPCSDFYLAEKSNYDDYYFWCKDYLEQRDFEYYDFNLIKEEYLTLEDEDFTDDNHFSKQGVYKWTQAFCHCFFIENISREKMFYNSYSQKLLNQPDKIYGLELLPSQDKKTITIKPMVNHVEQSRITYDIYTQIDGQEELMQKNTGEAVINLPSGKSGKIRVISYIDGIKQNDCLQSFAAF